MPLTDGFLVIISDAAMQKWFWLLCLVFSTFAQSPVNDLCSNAIEITSFPFTYAGTTINSFKEQTCTSSQYSGDVWFTFTPTTPYPFLRIGTCASAPQGRYNTVIYLTRGSCDSYTCLRGDDEGCNSNRQSLMTVSKFEVGYTYFIVVSGAASDSGTFTPPVY